MKQEQALQFFLQMQIVLSCAKGVYCYRGFAVTVTMATKTILLPLAWSHAPSWKLLQNNHFVYTVSISVRLSWIYGPV